MDAENTEQGTEDNQNESSTPTFKKFDRVTGVDNVKGMMELASSFKIGDEVKPVPVITNLTGPVSEGYVPMAVPVNQQVPKLDKHGKQEVNEKGRPLTERVTVALAVVQVPTMETIAQAGVEGIKFLEEAINAKLATRLNNNLKNAEDGSTEDELISRIPSTLAEWIETATAEGISEIFDKIAAPFVKALKKKGLATMTNAIFRRCLRDASYAEAQYQNIPAKVWEGLLDKVYEKFVEGQHPIATLDEWKENRDSRQAVEVGTIESLDDLDIQ